jgi:ABC-type sugar transport system substrate-binding protein
MNDLNVVLALITRENDYQAEQAATAIAVAARLGVKLHVVYAGNDAVNQTQQLVKIIQDPLGRPAAILVEPVGTGMIQVARAAVAAGIGWGVLNREPEYLSELRRDGRAPSFCVTVDQEEVGRIQGKQLAALVREGNVLYVEGPSNSSAVSLRTKGMLAAKPPQVMAKTLKGDWTEQSGRQALKSWLSLSTSRQLHIRAVVCQNDGMAMGARKALLDLTETDRDEWQSIPFTGCDGVTKTGQEWVRRGLLSATVITPPVAGTALEILVKALRTAAHPSERTQIAPLSFPTIGDLHLRPASTLGQDKIQDKAMVARSQPRS